MQYERSGGNQSAGGSYSENFSRQKRGLLVFLLDQSGSMQETATMQGYKVTLAQMASSILNSLLVTVIEKATLDTSTGRRKNYCDILVFGYGDNVVPLLNPSGVPVPLPDLAENPRGHHKVRQQRYDRMKGNYVAEDKDQPFWIEPAQKNIQMTEMAWAVNTAQQSVQNWLDADSRRSASFPPIVINITDGRNNSARGGDPVQEAMKLRQLGTNDGAVLLFNCHITKLNQQALSFPHDIAQIRSLNLPQEELVGAEQLFQMSSVIPATMSKRAQDVSGKSVSSGARGFIYNASGEDLVSFLSWGTLVDTERYK